MRKHLERIDIAQRNLTAIENYAVDELLAGRLDRRDFLRHGSVLGLSLPFLGGLVAAAGLGTQKASAKGKPGGTVGAGVDTPRPAAPSILSPTMTAAATSWFSRPPNFSASRSRISP